MYEFVLHSFCCTFSCMINCLNHTLCNLQSNTNYSLTLLCECVHVCQSSFINCLSCKTRDLAHKNHIILHNLITLKSKHYFFYYHHDNSFSFCKRTNLLLNVFSVVKTSFYYFFLVIFDHRELTILMSLNLSQYTQICIAIGITPGPT